jgi:hypothetical protein
MDQSKPTKRPPINTVRLNKLRLINDAKSSWRKERAEEREKLAREGEGGAGRIAVA